MTNEMKLLMALCDALGFEVESERVEGSATQAGSERDFFGNWFNLQYKLTKRVSSKFIGNWCGVDIYSNGDYVFSSKTLTDKEKQEFISQFGRPEFQRG